MPKIACFCFTTNSLFFTLIHTRTPAPSVCNSLVNNKKALIVFPRGRSELPPLGERHPLHLKWLCPSIRTAPFPTCTNKHETPGGGLCVCREVMWLGNEQCFPCRGFRLSHCEKKGEWHRKKNETGNKKLCFLYGSGNIEDQMKGSVKKRGKNLKEEEYRHIGGQRQIRKNINTFNDVILASTYTPYH